MEDRNVVTGNTISRTLHAARNGHTSVLAERLGRGADPNQDDRHGGTCLVASACYGNPECTRLLIEHGGDVTYLYSGDNASILFMLALIFKDESVDMYRPGDYVLTADLLVEAGAPIDEMQQDLRNDGSSTALDLLHGMAVEEESQHGRERHGLIMVLERQYWGEYGHNPFLDASPEEAAFLLLKGAANSTDGGVDITKVRSIEPNLREPVLDMLLEYKGMRETFMHILLTMKKANGTSPFCTLHGHESSIMPVIGEVAGASGWPLQNLEEMIEILGDVIEHFNGDGGGAESDGEDDDVDNDGDGDDDIDDEMDAAD